MREIKFRAWEEQYKIMHSWDEIVDIWGIDALANPSDCGLIPMQYIGLKDKNKVEVYERDIFRQKGMDSDLIVGTIVFGDDRCYYCREGEYIFHRVRFAGEVIGNIYENGDLLGS